MFKGGDNKVDIAERLKAERRTGQSSRARHERTGHGGGKSEGDASGSGSKSSCRRSSSSSLGSGSAETGDKCWSGRRRDPRVNGADIYVARVTKNGMGSAKPCWRCLEWCRWAGVKRILYWNGEENRFNVIKVNSADRDSYEVHSDVRLFAGSVSSLFCPLLSMFGSCVMTDISMAELLMRILDFCLNLHVYFALLPALIK